jgi:dihydrofolate reductase
MRISMIVAMARNGVIGSNGALPWHLPADLKRFKTLTMGHPLLMGRKTHESIGRPLPGRTNIILTSDPSYRAAGCLVEHSVADALARADDAAELFVIGGASLYEAFLAVAERIYLTLIDCEFEGDVRFPALDLIEWRCVELDDRRSATDAPFPYSFVVLERSHDRAMPSEADALLARFFSPPVAGAHG